MTIADALMLMISFGALIVAIMSEKSHEENLPIGKFLAQTELPQDVVTSALLTGRKRC